MNAAPTFGSDTATIAHSDSRSLSAREAAASAFSLVSSDSPVTAEHELAA